MKYFITLLSIAIVLFGCSTDKPIATNNALDIQNIKADFTPLDSTVGVWPSQSALYDPSNPFAGYAIHDQNKWDICNHSSLSKIEGYYCWSTALAQRNSHDNQFYAADLARQVYADLKDDDPYKAVARTIAIAGYRQYLENFPTQGPGINPDDKTPSAQDDVTKGELYVGTRDCGWHYSLTVFLQLDTLDTDYFLYTKTMNDGTVLDSLDSNMTIKPYCLSYTKDIENQCGISEWETGKNIEPDFQRWLPIVVRSNPKYGGCSIKNPTSTARADSDFNTKYWSKNKSEDGYTLMRKLTQEEYNDADLDELLH